MVTQHTHASKSLIGPGTWYDRGSEVSNCACEYTLLAPSHDDGPNDCGDDDSANATSYDTDNDAPPIAIIVGATIIVGRNGLHIRSQRVLRVLSPLRPAAVIRRWVTLYSPSCLASRLRAVHVLCACCA